MSGPGGQLGGERSGAASDIKDPRARGRQLPHKQPVVVGVVVPVQQPHTPIVPQSGPSLRDRSYMITVTMGRHLFSDY